MVEIVTAAGSGVKIRLKVVAGASRTKVAEVLGERLKVQVAAPPEGGKANKAVCELLAKVFGVPARNVSIVAGHGQSMKTALLVVVSVQEAAHRLGSPRKVKP